jgi:hypothetical protein
MYNQKDYNSSPWRETFRKQQRHLRKSKRCIKIVELTHLRQAQGAKQAGAGDESPSGKSAGDESSSGKFSLSQRYTLKI